MSLSARDWQRLLHQLGQPGRLRFEARESTRLWLLWIASMATLIVMLVWIEHAQVNQWSIAMLCVGVMVVLLLVGFAVWRILQSAARRVAASALRDIGQSVCGGCGQILCRFEDDPLRCPECGRESP